ncbi:MAG: M23 family metallopeptidase [Lachnospiraceae bacterium]|nr:M23 family metallopeptidase [Lachnospiraceae bacterium]
MKRITRYHKRIRFTRWKSHVLAVVFMMLLFPCFQTLEQGDDNLFHIYVNDSLVGTLGDADRAETCFKEARRQAASTQDGLLLADVELRTEGQSVLIGELDSEYQVTEAMKQVILQSQKETLNKAYTVKINQYMVNLRSIEEVYQLLEASLNRFDEEKQYKPSLYFDNTREMAVLSAAAVPAEEKEPEEVQIDVEEYFEGVGVQGVLYHAQETAEPTMEKDFSDYDLGLISMEFADTIEIVESYLKDSELKPLEEAVSEVTKDQEKEEIYEVQSGDTLSQIAEKCGLTLEDLIAINPSLEDERSIIRVEDELIITVPRPELSVNRQEQKYMEEDYEADIIYVDNDDWYTTQTKTLQEPSAGHRKVIAIVNYHNNDIVSVDIQKEEITYEAVPKIVERGTKIPPTYIKPISGGRLSSQFGRRNRPTKGASSYHKGVDWAIPVGTAVYASSAGTVTKAGWGRGYGYVIYIKHADGRETRYGHLSKVLVSSGQTVKQGQKIALSGNTGVSTGPHLHFEILINGSQVNPFKYLN